MAQACGHTIQKTLPSLTALETVESWPARLQGLSLKNTEITAMNGKKLLGCRFEPKQEL
jgi:predicted flavoprotein YhiN